jgi:predicted transcriptional regulator of viral defense system
MNAKPTTRQQRLAALLRATSGTIRVANAMDALDVDRVHAAKLLAGWHKQGVIRRVARGLYVPVSPASLGQNQVLDEPWILVPELYAPGYIGGWSALEHWELTEQLFRSVCVLTNKRTSYGETQHQGVNFYVKHIPQKSLYGTKSLWRENRKLFISDPHKTVLDIIQDPYIGAGLQHVIDCMREYKKRYPSKEDHAQLLEYAHHAGNGALFKKLGFLGESLGFDQHFVQDCAKHLTTGYAHLDKRAADARLVTRWRLWIPKGFKL